MFFNLLISNNLALPFYHSHLYAPKGMDFSSIVFWYYYLLHFFCMLLHSCYLCPASDSFQDKPKGTLQKNGLLKKKRKNLQCRIHRDGGSPYSIHGASLGDGKWHAMLFGGASLRGAGWRRRGGRCSPARWTPWGTPPARVGVGGSFYLCFALEGF